MGAPTLWLYQGDGGWFGHIDWKDGTRQKREGPFDTEAEAAVVVSRMGGMEPPDDMLEKWKREKANRLPA